MLDLSIEFGHTMDNMGVFAISVSSSFYIYVFAFVFLM